MIRIIAPHPLNTLDHYQIVSDSTPLCMVEHVRSPDGNIEWPATKVRADAIANALRHYQQSQEGERTP